MAANNSPRRSPRHHRIGSVRAFSLALRESSPTPASSFHPSTTLGEALVSPLPPQETFRGAKPKGRGKGFSYAELLLLAVEWCGTTEDPETGTDQKSKDFWGRIAAMHATHNNEYAGFGRDADSLARQ